MSWVRRSLMLAAIVAVAAATGAAAVHADTRQRTGTATGHADARAERTGTATGHADTRQRTGTATGHADTRAERTGTATGHADARAERTGTTAPPPLMGWTSWSSMRTDPTLASVEAQARALKRSGLAALGYDYVNVDDYWYVCSSRAGPAVDQYGRWIVDGEKFPADRSEHANGIQTLAAYVHHLGLKFGLYVTPGIPNQAVLHDTAIQGTRYRADQIVARGRTTIAEPNYNACGSSITAGNSKLPHYTAAGARPINYAAPGAQAFIDSWADELAGWGVDYVKLDGASDAHPGDIRAWSRALGQTGRSIHLELANNLAVQDAPLYRSYAGGWRTDRDIERNNANGTPGPTLTDWANVATRFDAVGEWQPYGGEGAYNDYDAIDIGAGNHDGLTVPERRTYLALWALGASPLILGSDLTHLDPTDLGLLRNRQVIAVDQDGIAATRVVDDGIVQVYAKTEPDGSVVFGLFDDSATATTTVSVDNWELGITTPDSVPLTDLWTGKPAGPITGTYSVELGPGEVQLLRTPPGAGSPGLQTLAWQAPNTLSGTAHLRHCTVHTAADGDQSTPVGPCAFAGGGLVENIGSGPANSVTINHVQASATTAYVLNFGFAVDGVAAVDISVDGGPPTVATLAGTGTTAPETASVLIHLQKGTNSIRFYNDDAPAPDLDNVTVFAFGHSGDSVS